jgi:hypothetical protein
MDIEKMVNSAMRKNQDVKSIDIATDTDIAKSNAGRDHKNSFSAII